MPLVQSPMKRYVPDLMSLQRTCEVNYMALMKLLPPGGMCQASTRLSGAEQIEHGRQRELHRSDAGDEVAATHAARFFERAEDVVQ